MGVYTYGHQQYGGQHITKASAVDKARHLLRVAPDATPDEIRTAFTHKVKESHPDAGGSGGDIQQLKQARNLLLEATKQRLPSENNAAMQPCQMCSGSGRGVVGFRNQRCTTCNGTGALR